MVLSIKRVLTLDRMLHPVRRAREDPLLAIPSTRASSLVAFDLFFYILPSFTRKKYHLYAGTDIF